MINYLFDASALLNIIRKTDDPLSYIKDGSLLDLTFYEIGNVVWKETYIHKRISVQEAVKLLTVIDKICGFMRTISPYSRENVLRVAYETGLTYYDASYIIVALENDLTLVTDDNELISKTDAGRTKISKLFSKTPAILTSRELIAK